MRFNPRRDGGRPRRARIALAAIVGLGSLGAFGWSTAQAGPVNTTTTGPGSTPDPCVYVAYSVSTATTGTTIAYGDNCPTHPFDPANPCPGGWPATVHFGDTTEPPHEVLLCVKNL